MESNINNKVLISNIIRFESVNYLSPREMAGILISIEKLYSIALFFNTIKRKRTQFSVKNFQFHFKEDYAPIFTESEGFHQMVSAMNFIQADLFNITDNKFLYSFIDKYPPQFKIQIKSIKYNSPWKIDLLGVGEIMGHVKDFILEIIRMKKTYDGIYLREKHEMEIKNLKLKNVEKFLSIAREYQLEYSTLNTLINNISEEQDFLSDMVHSNKIIEVSNPPEE